MPDIKAIETYYNGYRFRSRLEARWAVFFDAIGMPYQYEAEGYVGLNDTTYLPDFFFPTYDLYAEVKGTDESLRRDGKKIAAAIDYEATPVSNGLIILGNIPSPELIKWGNIPMFHCLKWNKGIIDTMATFYMPNRRASIVVGYEEILTRVFSLHNWKDDTYSDFYANGDIPGATSVNNKWTMNDLLSNTFEDIKRAYGTARRARFEHGEKPNL